MVEVLGTDLSLEHDRYVDLEGTTVRHPRDPFLVIRSTKDVVDFLRESHVFDVFRVLIPLLWRNLGEVPVGMIHRATGGLHGLDDHRLGRELSLFILGSLLPRDLLRKNALLGKVDAVGLSGDGHDER